MAPLPWPLVVLTTSSGLVHSFVPPLVTRHGTGSPLQALIYGWDDGGTISTSSDDDAYATVTPYDTGASCDAAGAAVAASLSVDPSRTGSLARLAVAFCPPSQGLALDKIYEVQVACVAADHIDLQAMVCQDGGCVSVAVPVTFPQQCDLSDDDASQRCVSNQLDALAERRPVLGTRVASLDDPVTNYPSWWYDAPADLQSECQQMRRILNEDDFAPEIRALAQQGSIDMKLHAAKVAEVGPAGLAFRAQTAPDSSSAAVVDVFYKFSTSPDSADALRAAILGAVATADE